MCECVTERKSVRARVHNITHTRVYKLVRVCITYTRVYKRILTHGYTDTYTYANASVYAGIFCHIPVYKRI